MMLGLRGSCKVLKDPKSLYSFGLILLNQSIGGLIHINPQEADPRRPKKQGGAKKCSRKHTLEPKLQYPLWIPRRPLRLATRPAPATPWRTIVATTYDMCLYQISSFSGRHIISYNAEPSIFLLACRVKSFPLDWVQGVAGFKRKRGIKR